MPGLFRTWAAIRQRANSKAAAAADAALGAGRILPAPPGGEQFHCTTLH